jgi:RNA:NAD 2'-phosphotransferase (TPT1/KptA family)
MLKTMRRAVRISEFLVLVLRHDPVRIGPTVDGEGWAVVVKVPRTGVERRSAERCGKPGRADGDRCAGTW